MRYSEWEEMSHCTTKVIFKTKKSAIEYVKTKSRIMLFPYKCDYKRHWHLTKNLPEKRN